MSTDPRTLRMADFTYTLPDERIARYPLPQRDTSKLLLYKEGQISEDIFRNVTEYMPAGATLVLNTARVVRARLHFKKPTGGVIEIFCLEPHPSYPDITSAMATKGEVLWQCLVGGAARWKEGVALMLEAGNTTVYAHLHSRNKTDFSIRFQWTPADLSWAEVLEATGEVPLPPYLHRAAEDADAEKYQTLFAQHEGSVAAPTASLHFTEDVMQRVAEKGIQTARVTLHVGAGTFKPVKSDLAGGHDMHSEWIEVSRSAIAQLISSREHPVIAAGTTALRTLESLYWIGCKTVADPDAKPQDLVVGQWEPYEQDRQIPATAALQSLLDWLEARGLDKLITRTGILIGPGYTFRIADALITNFHQPGSTLLLLVAAFIGDDWKAVYDYALAHDFRFLSYGDSSLLWRKREAANAA